MNNLQGLRVLVTRPDPAGTRLCHAIEAQGGKATHFPTLAFTEPHDLEALALGMQQLGDQDWLIFISPQAVYASVPLIRQRWPIFPPRVQFAAVGRGTARALKEAGYIVTAYPPAEWSGEGLLALPIFQAVAGKRIAIIRGEGGREQLESVLVERGAIVSSVMAYQRVLPAVDVTPYLSLFVAHQLDAVICTSFTGVSHFKLLMGEQGWPLISVIPLIVMSERIKKLANDLGFQTIWVPKAASDEALIAMLAEKKGELCRMKTNP